jgi:hypothetical protein
MFSALRPTATSFSPGALQHVIKKVGWHPLGVTAVRRFPFREEEARIRGRKTALHRGLHKTHGMEDPENPRNSKIRDANPEAACPFFIPPAPEGLVCATFPKPGEDVSGLPKLTAVAVYPKGGQPAFPVIRQMSDDILDKRVLDLCQWYKETAGISFIPPTNPRINTISGEENDRVTDDHYIHQRLNYCDN